MIHFIFPGLTIIMFMLIGCQTTGEVVKLQIGNFQESSETGGGNLKVAVRPFEDQRPHKKDLGIRTGHWGGITYYTLWNGNFGTGFSGAVVDFLQQKGFNAARAGSPSHKGTPDVTLSGKIKELTANAKSSFGSTSLEVKALVEFEVKNALDGSTVWITVAASETATEIWFDHEDMEELVNEVLGEVFVQFLEGTEVRGKALKRKT